MTKRNRSEVEQLQREVSLQRLAEVRGVTLHRDGRQLHGTCPFHTGAEQTLLIDAEANTWACSSCKASGGPVEWVMKAEGVSRRHALELLREGNPSLSKPTRGGRRAAPDAQVKHSTVPRLTAPIDADADDQQLLQQVVAYYHQTLKQSPEALAYLDARGLRSQEMVERFHLGFANRTLGYRLPAKNRRAGLEIRSRLARLGLLRDSGHEHFRGSVVVPVLDAQGLVVQMYGRKVSPNLRRGTSLHTQLPGGPRGVFNVEALGAGTSVILCQSLIDALTVWCAGYRNVTALLGLEARLDEHATVFKAKGIEKVLMAFRRDAAGDRAAEAIAAQLGAVGIDGFRVEFPSGLDTNDVALRAGADVTETLGRALQGAVWMGTGKAKSAPLLSPDADPTRLKIAKAEQVEFVAAAAPTPAELPATPVPEVAPPEPPALEAPSPRAPAVQAEIRDDEVVLHFSDRRYRIRGLGKNAGFEQLKVNVLVSRDTGLPDTGFHVDTLDLYAAKQRAAFIRQAAQELGAAEEVIHADLARMLFKLEELHEEALRKAAEPAHKEVALTGDETAVALELLRAPDLLDRILGDFERCGVVGEESNKLVGYLAAVSRKLDEPLAIIVQSTSAAGKTSLMEAVLALVPEEDRVKYSAVTGQSLFYMGETGLRHKVLAIAEEEGATRASYALKLLQSEGELTIASTGKEASTGRLVSHEYRVQGPVMLFLTTTAIDLDEELLNRCVVLAVDEDREQTRAIHRLQRQRQTLEGLVARREREALRKLHQNAQRLLKPLPVVNPYAAQLTFLDDRTRTRRDHLKYLGLIKAVALLHQHQRQVKTTTVGGEALQYIEVQPADIATANRLADAVLGRSLDEVPPHTRKLLVLLDQWVGRECERQGLQRRDFRFSRRQVREATGWGNTQLKVHLGRLVDLEYLLIHRGERGRSYSFELLWDGRGTEGGSVMAGLLDPAALQQYDAQRSASEGERSGAGRPPVGPESGHGRPEEKATSASDDARLSPTERPEAQNTHPGALNPAPSYPNEPEPS